MRPRPYLSWSQLSVLESSEDQYIRIYIGGNKLGINRGMALGKEIASSLETGEDIGDLVKDITVAKIPKLDLMEAELKATIKVGKEEVPLYGKADTASFRLDAFKEYKTGVTPWDQKKADQHGQITFYCVIIQAITGKVPQDIELIWAPTESIDGKPYLTGEVRRFKTKRSTADILKMKARMIRAWKRIEELTEGEIL